MSLFAVLVPVIQIFKVKICILNDMLKYRRKFLASKCCIKSFIQAVKSKLKGKPMKQSA